MPSSLTRLAVHLVFSTEQRVPILSPEVRPVVFEYMGGIIRNLQGHLLEAGGVADHAHLLFILHPTGSLSNWVAQIKGGSSHWVNEQRFFNARFAWQRGYGAFSVSESNTTRVRAYIRDQETHHRRVDFQTEYRHLLLRHNVSFDERYLWD